MKKILINKNSKMRKSISFLMIFLLLMCSTLVFGQGRTVTGVVIDASGPIIGANVLVKGTTNGSVTNLDGQFSISNVQPNAVLQVSYIGYIPYETNIGNQTNVTITILEDVAALEEIVVIGYGTVKKSDLTGSVASVKAEDLGKMVTQSPISALQGRAAGVSIVLPSGSPDAVANIQIRGIGTTNNNDPLFVVDGFPMRNIDYLSPNDIESIEILKDASATAIYGSRGANGVVLITTKKGNAGVLKVTVLANYGIEAVAKKPSMLNSTQYATLSNEAYANDGMQPVYPNPNNMEYNTDWYKEVMQTGQTQNYTLNLSGGSDRVTSLFSTTYYDRKGIIKSTNTERLSFTSNNTFKVTDFIDLGASFTGSFTNTQRLDPSYVFVGALIAPPDVPVINPDTDYYTGMTKIYMPNPMGQIARNNRTTSRSYLIGNFNANIKILKDLTFSTRFGIRLDRTFIKNFTPVYFETTSQSSVLSSVSRETQMANDWTWTNTLTYQKTFNGIHDLTVMGSSEARDYYTESYDATKRNVPIEAKEFWYFNSATEMLEINGTGNSLSMLSFLGRINYNLLNRYLLTFSMRADGSSRFIDENRWGYFPSGAFAWKISEENFFKNMGLDWFTSAKIRLGYGQIGNENISGYYPYNTPIGMRQYYVLGNKVRVNGANPTGVGNKDVQWETAIQYNAGLDLAFLRGKLNITADYFIRKTEDILLSQSIPRVSGFGTMTRNVGGMENKGFEFSISYKENKGDFSYNVNFNTTFIKNKVTSLGTTEALTGSFPYLGSMIDYQVAFPNIHRTVVGLPYRQFYGYVTDGIFQNQGEIDAYTLNGNKIQPDAAPGDFKFKDLNGNGRIESGDMTFIGNPYPDMSYGFSFDAAYKKFDISLLFQGVVGVDIFQAAKFYFNRFNAHQNVRTEVLNEYWHGEGTSNTLPAITYNTARNERNYRPSTYYIEDGTYLRLKNVQLGYTLRPNLSGLKTDIRIYLTMQNILTFTKYSGFEVEVDNDLTIDRGQYPQSQIFMIGTTINF